MVASPPSLRALLEMAHRAAEELVERNREDPISFVRWLPLQCEFLQSRSLIRQIRAGNQTIGKTWAALAEIIDRCLGRHPLREHGPPVPPPPVEWWVICSSWQQSLSVQKKLWALLPKTDQLHPRTRFDEVNGFSPTKSPTVVFANGSVIKIKTAKQDTLDLSSATIDGVLFDEPPKTQRLFVEIVQRVERRGGLVLLSYTPVNAPVDYLKELTKQGTIEDHWRPLTPAEFVPVGGTRPLRTLDGRPMDVEYIRYRRSRVPEHEQPVVIDGDWEFRAVGRYFHVFRNGGQDSHVHRRIPDHDVHLLLGIDHGSKPGKQIAVLVALWVDGDGRVHVYVVDEYVDRTGTATPADDARGILAMLTRNGLEWGDLDHVHGDRVHMPGTGEQKSNRDLQVQIAKELRLAPDAVRPAIRTVKRGTAHGAGSVLVRARWLFHRMVELDGFGIHPRCERTIAALDRVDPRRDDEWKDPFDAVAYAVDPWVFTRHLAPVVQLTVA